MRAGTDAAIELAQERVEQEREAEIARARHALSRKGEDSCVSCGEDIEEARRIAHPAARRCINCQTKFERKWRRR